MSHLCFCDDPKNEARHAVDNAKCRNCLRETTRYPDEYEWFEADSGKLHAVGVSESVYKYRRSVCGMTGIKARTRRQRNPI